MLNFFAAPPPWEKKGGVDTMIYVFYDKKDLAPAVVIYVFRENLPLRSIIIDATKNILQIFMEYQPKMWFIKKIIQILSEN